MPATKGAKLRMLIWYIGRLILRISAKVTTGEKRSSRDIPKRMLNNMLGLGASEEAGFFVP